MNSCPFKWVKSERGVFLFDCDEEKMHNFRGEYISSLRVFAVQVFNSIINNCGVGRPLKTLSFFCLK